MERMLEELMDACHERYNGTNNMLRAGGLQQVATKICCCNNQRAAFDSHYRDKTLELYDTILAAYNLYALTSCVSCSQYAHVIYEWLAVIS